MQNPHQFEAGCVAYWKKASSKEVSAPAFRNAGATVQRSTEELTLPVWLIGRKRENIENRRVGTRLSSKLGSTQD